MGITALLPTTALGWVTLIAVAGGIVVGVWRSVVAITRNEVGEMVDKSFDEKLAKVVEKAVKDGLNEAMVDGAVSRRFDAIDLRLNTQAGEMARITDLERKIDNGINERSRRTEQRQIAMEDRQRAIERDVAVIKAHVEWVESKERPSGA